MRGLRCPVCHHANPAVGLLCEPCAQDLAPGAGGPCREQVVGPGRRAAAAWLLDGWGRAHAVVDGLLIGRAGAGLAIHAPGVSRRHARLARRADGWRVADLGSRNGTWVGRRRVDPEHPLRHGDVLQVTSVRLRFAVTGLPADAVCAAGADLTPPWGAARLRRDGGSGLELVEHRGGGGGVLQRGAAHVPLTLAQFVLVEALLARRAADGDGALGGYVAASELLDLLPWATSYPGPPNLKQLVRRLRGKLAALGVGIEGRHGLGYRLRLAR